MAGSGPGWFGGGRLLEVELDGVDAVNAALSKVQPHLREATVPVMESIAREIAAGAEGRLDRGHPSNLFRRTGGRAGRPANGRRARRHGVLPGSYRVHQAGPYMFRVRSMSGASGKAQALSEWARLAVTGQGAALVRALDSVYGRAGGSGNGRVLWAVADEVAAGAPARVQAAVDAAAAKIQSDMGGA